MIAVSRLGRVLAVAVLAGSASCVPMFPAPPDPYIGPVSALGAAGGGTATAEPTSGPLELTLNEAILRAMENNQGLVVQRYNPAISKTLEEQQRAVFDPTLTADLSGSRSETSNRGATQIASNVLATAGLSQFFPTGTTVALDLSASRAWTPSTRPMYSTGPSLSVTQSLLRGFGLDVNLASLRQSRIDTLTTDYELRGFAEALLAQIETTYWNYVLATRQIEIFEESLKVAKKQLQETEQRINVGALADTERWAAEAEVALRNEGLIDANSTLQKTRLQLLRLLNPRGTELWQRKVTLKDEPPKEGAKLEEVEDHVLVALRMRPDLNAARLGVRRGELEIVKTRNGLLPKMDLFVTLGKTGYAGSFGGSVGDIPGKSYNASAGVQFEYALGNRDARARNERAVLSRDQAADSVRNVEQLVQVDVRSAYEEAKRALAQVTATAATEKLQEQKVRAETARFQAGKSTSLLVAEAQRDLLASQISRVQAVIGHMVALVDLYQLDGSLLERRGIRAPGWQPADKLYAEQVK